MNGYLGRKVGHVGQSALVRVDGNRFVAASGRGGGIGSVRRGGHEHEVAVRIAPVHMVRPYQHEAEQFAVRARGRLQTHRVHAEDRLEHFLHLVQDGYRSLGGFLGLQRVHPREAGHEHRLIVHLGVVFHGARTKRVEALVDAIVELGQAKEMPHDIAFRQFGQWQCVTKRYSRKEFGQGNFGHVRDGQRHAEPSWTGHFEQGGFQSSLRHFHVKPPRPRCARTDRFPRGYVVP